MILSVVCGCALVFFFFFKQKTAYEMRISDWSSDVCSSDLKVPVAERQPLVRPKAANEVWSMDFVFDRTAERRVIKCLTVVDDATHEAVVIEVARALSGIGVTRVMDRLAKPRGLPKVIRSDNGKDFRGKEVVIRTDERRVGEKRAS